MGMDINAPRLWRCIDCISDLHLQADEAATFEVWQNYMQGTSADALFILGDLFEVWVGDDVLADADCFEARCARVLHQTASRIPVFIMAGNRDFLMGPALMQACGATLLNDPTVLAWAGQRWLLTHGDALCVSDLEYMQFRSVVRSAAWRQEFLAKPLLERLALARAMRTQSESRKRDTPVYADVDTKTAIDWVETSRANQLIHGHTHRPATHILNGTCERIVLSDWDAGAQPPRVEVLRLRWSGQESDHASVERIPVATATAPAR